MNLAVVVAAGVLGAGLGAFTTDFAMSVPARGHLPRPTRLPFPSGRGTWALLGGMAVSASVCAMLAALPVPWGLAAVYCLCGVIAVALGIIDVRVRRLPYMLAGVMYASCVAAFLIHMAITGEVRPLVRALVAGAVAFLAFLVLALAFPGQLGLGDVVLVGWIALSLGWFAWRAAALGLLVGLVVQAAGGVVLLARAGPRRTLPMGPALLLGWLVGVMAGAW